MTTKKPSKAEMRRRMAALKDAKPVTTLAPDIAKYIDDYEPRSITEDEWLRVKPFVSAVMQQYGGEWSEATRQRVVALVAFGGWALRARYQLTPSLLGEPRTINAFVATVGGVNTSTAATYRSRLRGLAEVVAPGTTAPVSVRVGHRSIKPPYTDSERAAILRIAMTQPSAGVGRQLRACVGLGLGAGLDSTDLRTLTAGHVDDQGDDGLVVQAGGRVARTVWVRHDLEELVRAGLEGLRPGQRVIGVKGDRRNVAARVFDNAVILGNAPHFEQGRMRTTWLACLLRDGLPLPVIMDAAGLTSARTLTDLAMLIGDLPQDGRAVRGGAR